LLKAADKVESPRTVYLLQRSAGKLGAGLGKTTGWIHRTSLKNRRVNMIGGVKYVSIDDRGLTIELKGKQQLLDVDNVVICAGQESLKHLVEPLQASGKPVFKIGGAELAAELDAKRAIDQGTRLAAAIESAKSGEVFNQPVTMGYEIAQQLRAFVPK
jgi:2,4-dienoyl-CoA reductase (NADPH2)